MTIAIDFIGKSQVTLNPPATSHSLDPSPSLHATNIKGHPQPYPLDEAPALPRYAQNNLTWTSAALPPPLSNSLKLCFLLFTQRSSTGPCTYLLYQWCIVLKVSTRWPHLIPTLTSEISNHQNIYRNIYFTWIKNDDAYKSYFTWRKHFTYNKLERGVKKVFCDFCRYLFEDKRPKVIQNFTKWFFDDAECEAFPKQLYGSVQWL